MNCPTVVRPMDRSLLLRMAAAPADLCSTGSRHDPWMHSCTSPPVALTATTGVTWNFSGNARDGIR